MGVRGDLASGESGPRYSYTQAVQETLEGPVASSEPRSIQRPSIFQIQLRAHDLDFGRLNVGQTTPRVTEKIEFFGFVLPKPSTDL